MPLRYLLGFRGINYLGREIDMVGVKLAFIDQGPTGGRWCEYPKMGRGGGGYIGSFILASFTYLHGFRGTNYLGR